MHKIFGEKQMKLWMINNIINFKLLHQCYFNQHLLCLMAPAQMSFSQQDLHVLVWYNY